ncbi:unnamed protein product [Tenebrio molitor]|nr:unnamed protein product [Tenebrio molitor]
MRKWRLFVQLYLHNLYISEKKQPTLKGILKKIQDSGLSFGGGLTTLSRVLKKMGFR